MTIAWKFLDDRFRDPLSGTRWPVPTDGQPGGWVNADGVGVDAGVRACTVDQLAWWMSEQLWEVELDGMVAVRHDRVVAERGRLLRHVESWPGIGDDMSVRAVWSVRDFAVAVLTMAGDTAGADAFSAAADVDAVAAAATTMETQLDTPAGIAVAAVVDVIDDIGYPVLACHDAARAAGHRASAIDDSVASYQHGFSAERLAQSRWIAQRVRIGGR